MTDVADGKVHEHGTNADIAEFAAGLNEVNPDMTDAEVCAAIDEYTGKTPGYTNSRSPFGMTWCAAYEAGSVKAASRMSNAAFGLDLTTNRD